MKKGGRTKVGKAAKNKLTLLEASELSNGAGAGAD